MKKIALIICITLILGLVGCVSKPEDVNIPDIEILEVAERCLAQAEYPDQLSFPNEEDYENEEDYDAAYAEWIASRPSQVNRVQDSYPYVSEFLRSSVKTILAAEDEGNTAYSPINVYMALSMLAETTGGESQKQLLHFLGAKDLETLRSQTKLLWTHCYRDDGAAACVLANALLLDQDISYVEQTVRDIAEHHYATVFRDRMGTKSYDQLLQAWLNEQTGGLLKEQIAGVKTRKEYDMILASTVYFFASWADKFTPEKNTQDIFYAKNGNQTVEYMHQTSHNMPYYQSDRYTAVRRYFEEGGSMWLILPNEGVDVMEVATDDRLLDPVLSTTYQDFTHPRVMLSLPKFDITSSKALIPSLQSLGIKDIFKSGQADFSPLIGQKDNGFISDIRHDVRVCVDEEGCAAAAFTTIARAGSAMPPEELVEFELNRPFIFIITSDSGLPLFVGIVQNP